MAVNRGMTDLFVGAKAQAPINALTAKERELLDRVVAAHAGGYNVGVEGGRLVIEDDERALAESVVLKTGRLTLSRRPACGRWASADAGDGRGAVRGRHECSCLHSLLRRPGDRRHRRPALSAPVDQAVAEAEVGQGRRGEGWLLLLGHEASAIRHPTLPPSGRSHPSPRRPWHIYRAWVEGEDVDEYPPFFEGKAGGWHDAAHRAGLKLEAEGDETHGCVLVIKRSDGASQMRVLERVITFNSRLAE